MPTPFFLLAPVILNDDIFFAANPSVIETGTAQARQMAYLSAEQNMMNHLNTPLLLTQVSGTYLWPLPYRPITLDFCRVVSIDALTGNTFDNGCTCDLTKLPGCASIRSYYGYIDPRIIQSTMLASCSCSQGQLYNIDVVYTCGLPTGVAANDLGLHLGLAKAAAMDLMQIVNPGAAPGGPGNPGVDSWSADGYSQKNIPFKQSTYSVFGMSAEAHYIVQKVKHLKLSRPLNLHG